LRKRPDNLNRVHFSHKIRQHGCLVTRTCADFEHTLARADVGLLDRSVLWGLTFAIIGVAIAGKWLASAGMARVAGYSWMESSALGALLNTRGLTELIVLNIGLELGVISHALFSMLVVMALVTTFMTAPALPSSTRGAG
jgi:Kef-type K+ transport system membrane component KefB